MLRQAVPVVQGARTTVAIATVESIPLAHPLAEGASYGSARGETTERTATLVRVETENGTVGWGEASGPPRVLATIVDEILADWIVGRPASAVGSLTDKAYASLYHFNSGGLLQSAISALDIALWDLKGRETGQPIVELLGGANRTGVRPYASTMYFTSADRDPSAAVRRAVDEGFDAVKIKLGRGIDEDLERVRAARDALDDGLLMVDCNGNYRADQAIRLAAELEPYDVHWFEEPVAPENVEGYREVRASTTIPIAGGEAALGRFPFKRLLEARAIDIAQPDVCMCGGLSEAMTIARMAAAENVGVSPHCWMGGVGLAASIHFTAALPRYPHADVEPEPPVLEVDRADNPLRTDLLVDDLDLVSRQVEVPDGPGLGVIVDTDAVDRFRLDG